MVRMVRPRPHGIAGRRGAARCAVPSPGAQTRRRVGSARHPPDLVERSAVTRVRSPAPVLVEVRRGDVRREPAPWPRGPGRAPAARSSGPSAIRTVEVTLRSSVKPFALVALVESGAADDLRLSHAELAVMAASHTGEDKPRAHAPGGVPARRRQPVAAALRRRRCPPTDAPRPDSRATARSRARCAISAPASTPRASCCQPRRRLVARGLRPARASQPGRGPGGRGEGVRRARGRPADRRRRLRPRDLRLPAGRCRARLRAARRSRGTATRRRRRARHAGARPDAHPGRDDGRARTWSAAPTACSTPC